MRPIRLEESDSDHTWLWLAGGAALGLVAGLLIADRMKGRTRGLRGLVGRGRTLATTALRTVGPLLETARSIKAAWDDPTEEEDEPADASEAERTDDDADDAEDGLDARVLAAFENDPVLSARAVEIDEPRPGVIVLRGRVRSAREVRLAVTLTHGIPGVTRVRERLTVRERPR